MTYKGKINQYRCNACKRTITTVDSDEGTTPMYIACRQTGGCAGMMRSAFYSVDQTLKPDYEWYKPTGKVKAKNGLREYVKMGGLLIRELEKAK